MAVRGLAPFQANRAVSRWPEDSDPLVAFRRDMSRMFDAFFGGFGAPGMLAPALRALPPAILTPQINISETDEEIRITADLPGLDEDDIEVKLADGMLTIGGEKAAETEADEEEEGERSYHLVERTQGAFSRTLLLPFAVEPEDIDAEFKNGVLTITIPKPKAVQEKTHKIAVRSGDDQPPAVDRAAAGDKPAASAPTAAKAKASQGAAE